MKKAVKSQKRLRMAIGGASGSGKTRSALEIAKYLGPRIGVIDTEYKSASLYADKVEFDVEEIVDDYNPERLIKALAQHGANYDVIVIDSLTHFWNGKGGMLDMADQEVKKMVARGGKADSFSAWKNVTPLYARVVQAILGCHAHVLVTIRAKQDYVRENGKIQKIGLAPEFRAEFNFEMDVDSILDQDHNLLIGKTRCEALDGKMFNKPGRDVAEILLGWLNSGTQEIDLVTSPVPTVPPSSDEMPTIPQAAKVPLLAVFTSKLTAAAGDKAQLEALRVEITEAAKMKSLTPGDYSELGKLYTSLRTTQPVDNAIT